MRQSLIFWVFSTLVFTACSINIFEPAANKDKPSTIYYQTKKYLDDRKYAEAIAELDRLTAADKQTSLARELYASSYAGACGMEFITFFSTLTSGAPTNLFTFFMAAWNDRATTPAYCSTAQDYMKAIGATRDLRDANQNMFMAILGMATAGSYIRNKADLDGPNSLGDGTVDGTFDACSGASLTDNEVKNIAVAMRISTENLGAIEASLDTLGQALDLVIDTYCGATDCTVLDESEIVDEAAFVNRWRNILASNDVGLGSTTPLLGTPCP